jgi:hypothetical protein
MFGGVSLHSHLLCYPQCFSFFLSFFLPPWVSFCRIRSLSDCHNIITVRGRVPAFVPWFR